MKSNSRGFVVLSLALTTLLSSVLSAGPASAAATTSRVSWTGGGTQANGASSTPAVSGDGRYVAFTSSATNLVTGDTNGVADVFVRDRTLHITSRVSLSSLGQSNGASSAPALSADGRYIAFVSSGSNLVTGDTNGAPDVFVRDRIAHITSRVSVPSTGQANGGSSDPAISTNGRYVAFTSAADNLVTGDTNGAEDVFVRDITAGTIARVSWTSGGTQPNGASRSPAISLDGRYVAFESEATNLVSGDTNGSLDVFVRDRTAHSTTRMSVADGGAQSNGSSSSPAISAENGRYVAFVSSATNLIATDTNGVADVYVRDRLAGETDRVSWSAIGQPNAASTGPAISLSGRYVAFQSAATNLTSSDTNGKTDAFVRDRFKKTTIRLSDGYSGAQPDGDSGQLSVSANGWHEAFESEATNLVSGDTNVVKDAFVRSPIGSVPASLIGQEWSKLPTTAKVVALTFDAGANADGVPSILSTLKSKGVTGTFFLTGKWVEAFPDSAMSIGALYPVGNHTYDHPHLTQLSDSAVRSEVTWGQDAILSASGWDSRPLFRFPYGDVDGRVIGIVNSLGYGGIRWTVDTLGWQGTSGGQSVDAIVNRVMANLQPGAIVLMHVGSNPNDGSTLDAAALPRMIDSIRAKGYSMVTVDQYA